MTQLSAGYLITASTNCRTAQLIYKKAMRGIAKRLNHLLQWHMPDGASEFGESSSAATSDIAMGPMASPSISIRQINSNL
jgi:hypothetical protein